jgi:hypothetical protein
MAYIGNIPAEKYQTLQKQSFTTSATDTYTLSYSVTNPQDLALFINNVRQNPNDAYTVSGTTLTLSSAITSSDTMYAVFLGRAVETVAPATGSVTNAMLAGSIDESKLLGSIPNSKLANSTISVNGTSIALGASGSISTGLTEVDMWRLNASHTGSTVFTNWERIDNLNGTYVGTGMSVSSGVFTFPSTGKYYIDLKGHTENPNANNTDVDVRLQVSTDGGSNFNTTSSAWSQGRGSGYTYHFGTFTLLDVTSTSNVKVRVRSNSPRSDQSYYGDTNRTDTGIMFMKVGST